MKKASKILLTILLRLSIFSLIVFLFMHVFNFIMMFLFGIIEITFFQSVVIVVILGFFLHRVASIVVANSK